MRIRAALLAVLPAMLAAAGPAQAQLLSTCTSLNVTVDPLSFSYLPASASQNSANIKISCGFGLFVLPDITVSLTAGNSGSYTARQMNDTSGNNHLLYNVYTTSGYATVWGDGTGGTQTQGVNGTLLGDASYTFVAYGLVPAGQYVTATSYSDQLTVHITF